MLLSIKKLLIVSLTAQCQKRLSDRNLKSLNVESSKFIRFKSRIQHHRKTIAGKEVLEHSGEFYRKFKTQTCRAAFQLAKQRAMFSSGRQSCAHSLNGRESRKNEKMFSCSSRRATNVISSE